MNLNKKIKMLFQLRVSKHSKMPQETNKADGLKKSIASFLKQLTFTDGTGRN